MPNRSRTPCTTSRGTETASSSCSRLGVALDPAAFDPARGGGCSGNARQSTPTARVVAAVRHATRAPDERPPHDEPQPLQFACAQLVDHVDPGGVELVSGSRRAPAGDAVGLLDERDADADCERGSRRGEQIRGAHSAAGPMPEHERGARRLSRMQVHVRLSVTRLDRQRGHQLL